MDFVEVKRYGYGSNFNNIYVNDTQIKKQAKNTYGNAKIQKEMLFYKYINDHHIPFNVPQIHEFGSNYYIMEYLKDYKPLFHIFTSLSAEQKNAILQTIDRQLHLLHLSNCIVVGKQKYMQQIQKEMYTKLTERYLEILPLVHKYSFIENVNGIRLLTFDTAINKIYDRILNYVNQQTVYSFCLIHGDCQFNNILYNPATNDIRFIDPRGYFGDQTLFGIREYDHAKIKFALCGYDIFDSREITALNIQGNNIILDDISFAPDVLTDDLTSLITLTIWLGNAHCFKTNIFKTMTSYFYALYLAALYFIKYP